MIEKQFLTHIKGVPKLPYDVNSLWAKSCKAINYYYHYFMGHLMVLLEVIMKIQKLNDTIINTGTIKKNILIILIYTLIVELYILF